MQLIQYKMWQNLLIERFLPPPTTSNEVEEKSNGTTLLLGSLVALAVGAGIYALTKGKSKPSTEATKPVENAVEHTELVVEDAIKQQIAEVKNLIDKYKDFPKKYLTCPKLKSKDTFNSLKDIPFQDGKRDVFGGRLIDSVEEGGIKKRTFIKGDEEFLIYRLGSNEPVYYYNNNNRYFERFRNNEVTLSYKFKKGPKQVITKEFAYAEDGGKLGRFKYIHGEDGKTFKISNYINEKGLIESGSYTSENSNYFYQFTDNKLSDLTLQSSGNKSAQLRFNPNEEIISCMTY